MRITAIIFNVVLATSAFTAAREQFNQFCHGVTQQASTLQDKTKKKIKESVSKVNDCVAKLKNKVFTPKSEEKAEEFDLDSVDIKEFLEKLKKGLEEHYQQHGHEAGEHESSVPERRDESEEQKKEQVL